jgi:hypothetical protein
MTNYLAAVLAGGLLLSSALADSIPSECGFSAHIETPPESTTACTFSQRQGFIFISLDDGREFDFRPTGETPGNFIAADGAPVYRRSGLGKAGQIFMLPDEFLFVYWYTQTRECRRRQLTEYPGCALQYGSLGFRVSATNTGSLNQLSLQATGLENGGQSFALEIDGTAYKAELADLDANGWPEIYIYVSSAGSGSYGSLVAYAVNAGKSISPVFLPSIAENVTASDGYMGHDEFAVVENRLVHRFPIYRDGDTNSAPTGGMRQLQYRLVASEAGWQLVIDKVIDF